MGHILDEFLEIMMQIADEWITFPITQNEFQEKKNQFVAKGYVIPNIVGVIDCTHVELIRPHDDPIAYYGRKNFPSINVQGTVDARECFTSIDVSFPGSVHDARIYRLSDVYTLMSSAPEAANCILLGDEAYPISPWLLTPFRRRDFANLQPHQINYNTIIARERVIVERCFGILKRRFPCLAYELRYAPPKAQDVIIACVILHNIAKFVGDPDHNAPLDPIPDVQLPERDNLVPAAVRQGGQNLREQVALQLANRRLLPRRQR